MKNIPIWNILTGFVLLGIACLVCGFLTIFLSPVSAINPFPPPPTLTMVVIAIPTATEPQPIRVLPPTWTPVTGDQIGLDSPRATPTLRPTSTLIPTNTLWIAPTGTATLTFTPKPSATRADARCFVMSEDPEDNTVFSPNQEFDKRWTLRNNSHKTWVANDSDFRYVGGSKLHTGSDVYDLSHDISHGSDVTFSVRMRAPSAPGVYTGNWALTGDGGELCKFFVKIEVKP